VQELHQFLNSLDKKVQDTSYSNAKKHIFQWFLTVALILIFIDTLTTEHKLFNNKKQQFCFDYAYGKIYTVNLFFESRGSLRFCSKTGGKGSYHRRKPK